MCTLYDIMCYAIENYKQKHIHTHPLISFRENTSNRIPNVTEYKIIRTASQQVKANQRIDSQILNDVS